MIRSSYIPIVLDDRTETRLVETLDSIEKLEHFINAAEFLPATQTYRGTILLALLSKCFTVGRAVCALVEAGFSEEAFGLSRTLIDIYFTVRYISNKNTEVRAERFTEFFLKNHESWTQIVPRFYPDIAPLDSEFHKMALEVAKKYKSPHEWSGETQKTKSLAMEPDEYEFDANGKGTTAEFDYEVMFKWTSHFVHSTVSALQNHAVERGDIFRVRSGFPKRAGRSTVEKPLFQTLAFISKTVVCAFRGLRQEQPDEILQEMHLRMKSY